MHSRIDSGIRGAVLLASAVLLVACGDRLRASGASTIGPSGRFSPPPDSGAAGSPSTAGLVSAAAGATELRLAWVAGDEELELGLFVGGDEARLLDEPPVATPSGDGSLILTGLASGRQLFAALGVREPGGTTWTRAGHSLPVRTGSPLYVDPSADPGVADGLTPETAFSLPILALLTALSQGGGNVWLLAGDYADVALPVFDGVGLFGGFAPGFALDERDPEASPTVLRGSPGLAALDARSPVLGAVLDGLRIDGAGAASIGVDATDARLSIRDVHIRACAGRGIRLRAGTALPVPVSIQRSSSSANGGDGLSADGSFDLTLDGCVFEGNVQEGADLDDLVAPPGETAALRVRGSIFRGNGTDGLDVDLVAPPLLAVGSGRFEVRVERSWFEGNGEEGLLVDADYEGAPGWSADVRILGCRSRANAQNGFHLDLDAAATTFVHRVLATANVGDGLWISSESAPGHALVTSSACLGNGGLGMRASLGNQVLLASHCAVAGNGEGGIGSSFTTAGVVSTVAHRQAAAWQGALVLGSVDTELDSTLVFENAPEAYARVLSFDGTALVLDRVLPVEFGSLAEIDDDGVARSPELLAPDTLTLDPAPTAAPVALEVYPARRPVADDLRLAPGSPAVAAGFTSGAVAPDAGPFGAPLGGAPGRIEELAAEPFRFASLFPAALPPAGGALTLRFAGGSLDPGSVSASSLRAVRADGSEVALVPVFGEGELSLLPESGDWGSDLLRLELHAGLASTAGAPIVAPVAIPLDPVPR